MRRILILGAGRSAPYLIRRLLESAAVHHWQVTVADRDLELAEARVAGDPTGRQMENLRFLGLFDNGPTGCAGDTAAAMLSHLLETRLAPLPESRDMVIIVHDMEVDYPDGGRASERQTFTMVEYGEPVGMSAMAKTVGLPAAIAVEMLVTGEIELRGCLLPSHPKICYSILARLRAEGLEFMERIEPL